MNSTKQTFMDVGLAGIGGVTFDLTANALIAFLVGVLITIRILLLLPDLYKKWCRFCAWLKDWG